MRQGDTMDVKTLLNELNDSISSSYDKNLEKTLDRLGLERKGSRSKDILPALGIFGAGIAVGATLGVLFAPKRGDELRSELAKNLDELRQRSRDELDQVARESRRRFEEARDRVQEARQRGKGQTAANKDDGSTDDEEEQHESAGE
jgi:gas vesicle protein